MKLIPITKMRAGTRRKSQHEPRAIVSKISSPNVSVVTAQTIARFMLFSRSPPLTTSTFYTVTREFFGSTSLPFAYVKHLLICLLVLSPTALRK